MSKVGNDRSRVWDVTVLGRGAFRPRRLMRRGLADGVTLLVYRVHKYRPDKAIGIVVARAEGIREAQLDPQIYGQEYRVIGLR